MIYSSLPSRNVALKSPKGAVNRSFTSSLLPADSQLLLLDDNGERDSREQPWYNRDPRVVVNVRSTSEDCDTSRELYSGRATGARRYCLVEGRYGNKLFGDIIGVSVVDGGSFHLPLLRTSSALSELTIICGGCRDYEGRHSE